MLLSAVVYAARIYAEARFSSTAASFVASSYPSTASYCIVAGAHGNNGSDGANYFSSRLIRHEDLDVNLNHMRLKRIRSFWLHCSVNSSEIDCHLFYYFKFARIPVVFNQIEIEWVWLKNVIRYYWRCVDSLIDPIEVCADPGEGIWKSPSTSALKDPHPWAQSDQSISQH